MALVKLEHCILYGPYLLKECSILVNTDDVVAIYPGDEGGMISALHQGAWCDVITRHGINFGVRGDLDAVAAMLCPSQSEPDWVCKTVIPKGGR